MKSKSMGVIATILFMTGSIASAATVDISLSNAGDGYFHDETGGSWDYFDSGAGSLSAHYQFWGTSDTLSYNTGYAQFSLSSAPAAASIISATLYFYLDGTSYLTAPTPDSGSINHASNSSGATGSASQRIGGDQAVGTIPGGIGPGWSSFDVTSYLVNDIKNGYGWSAFSFNPNTTGDYSNRFAGYSVASSESGNGAYIRFITGIVLTVSPSGPTNNSDAVTIAADSGAINGTWNGTATGGTLAGAYVSGTPVVLTATLPAGTVVSWGTGCDTTTETTCTIDSLTVDTTISPIFSVLCYQDSDKDGYGSSTSVSDNGDGVCLTADSESTVNTDCDDTDASEHPGVTWYADADVDTYGNPSSSSTCQRAALGDVLDNTDCDDTDASEHPGVTWYADADTDTYGNPSSSNTCQRAAVDDVLDNTDCDDTKANVNPGLTEMCDGLDNDCNIAVDDNLTPPANTLQQGVCAGSTQSCTGAGGWVDNYSGIATYEPGTETTCDTLDNDCDGTVDESLTTTYYQDADLDTYGNPSVSQNVCSQPAGYVLNNTDCNDSNASINPGASDVPGNDIDENCSGYVACYADSDNDGFGVGSGVESSYIASGGTAQTSGACASSASDGFDDTNNDCADTNPSINPGAGDVPGNDLDENCSGSIACYIDPDNDGFGAGSGVESSYIASGGTAQTFGACASSASDGFDDTNNDCNNTNAGIYPGNAEVVGDSVDQDCDFKDMCYQDNDSDNYGTSTTINGLTLNCTTDAFRAPVSGDCDDTNAGVYPGRAEVVGDGVDQDCDFKDMCYQDNDNDNYGTSTTVNGLTLNCTTDSFRAPVSGDCNDSVASINPGATEVCDGVDNDCSGTADNNLTPPANTLQQGVCAGSTQSCTGAGGWVDNYSGIATYEPGTEATCDTLDNDCDGTVDESLTTTYYQDADLDTYGNPSVGQNVCSQPAGYVLNNTDCNDSNASINPGASELCDGLDNDCNGSTVDGSGESWLGTACDGPDTDLCTEGTYSCSSGTQSCSDSTGNNIDLCNGADDDCNPATADGYDEPWLNQATNCGVGECASTGTYVCSSGTQVDTCAPHPSNPESCDGLDNDCDGQIDNGVQNTYYFDFDKDTYGDAKISQDACAQPVNYVSDNTDCDDANKDINPGAKEICDQIDNNCNAQTDENGVCKGFPWPMFLPAITGAGR